ncbi:type II toxin-antitoxin system RelE/ParE family toxin [Candidatus Woesearchaeota archaeon]|nr:type II toxin-antitoxin system RelE/ParE family toxin [Candidatus Woesearchaeota archaeon]
MYSVELSQKAQKFLEKLDLHIKIRIEERLKKLSDNPILSDSKFIYRENNEKIFRYRIGDYRALYIVKDSEKVVLIAKIDKRPRVYERE